MKAGLKRIEATLHDLGTRHTTAADSGEPTKRSFSFRISVNATETPGMKSPNDEDSTDLGDENRHSATEQHLFPHHPSVETFPAQETGGKAPSLPKFKSPSFSNHRHAANPALAMNMLQEIQEVVAAWQRELQKILKQIQDIYLEGPIINGWLESNVQEVEPQKGTATLRHAEVDQLMNFVEEICATASQNNPSSIKTGYRLCGVDDAGQVWSRPCPPEQIPNVSVAIARYQRLRQLLAKQQYLENKLHQLSETLVVLHSHIQQI
jgi:hypothetical protein